MKMRRKKQHAFGARTDEKKRADQWHTVKRANYDTFCVFVMKMTSRIIITHNVQCSVFIMMMMMMTIMCNE